MHLVKIIFKQTYIELNEANLLCNELKKKDSFN